MSNYTYIVRCADGTFYTGWTTCLERLPTTEAMGRNIPVPVGR